MSETIKPLTPKQVIATQSTTVDPIIIQAINELLIENLDSSGKYAGFNWPSLKEKLEKLGAKYEYKAIGRALKVFGESGWEVSIDSPGYNEAYDTTYKFEAQIQATEKQSGAEVQLAKLHKFVERIFFKYHSSPLHTELQAEYEQFCTCDKKPPYWPHEKDCPLDRSGR